jgi:hypothetical protein
MRHDRVEFGSRDTGQRGDHVEDMDFRIGGHRDVVDGFDDVTGCLGQIDSGE